MERRVLIVDDHDLFRAWARALLEQAGYEVVSEAADGAAAVSAASELRPDAVLLDIQLPDTDGFAVAQQLCNGAGGPAVVLTSSRDLSGATVDRGSGLRGLGDRVAAIAGRLDLDSPVSGGTRLRAELPCA